MLDRRFISLGLSVLKIAATPDENPAAGDQYIVASEPSGDFAGANANDVARYDGTTWRFSAPSATQPELLNLETGKFLRFNGSAWTEVASLGEENMAPIVDFVKPVTTNPTTADTIGQKFLNTTDGKIYTSTAENTFDEGVTVVEGARYVGSTDNKLYTKSGGSIVSFTLPDGAIFLCKADGFSYAYNGTSDTVIKLGVSDETVTESHTLTAEEATAKSFNLTNTIKTGTESSVLLSVCGVTQVAGVDFTASGSAISWSGKGLESIGLTAGDVFTVTLHI